MSAKRSPDILSKLPYFIVNILFFSPVLLSQFLNSILPSLIYNELGYAFQSEIVILFNPITSVTIILSLNFKYNPLMFSPNNNKSILFSKTAEAVACTLVVSASPLSSVASGELNVTVGTLVYPLPLLLTLISTTFRSLTTAFASSPQSSGSYPGDIVIVGGLVYPEPGFVTVILFI